MNDIMIILFSNTEGNNEVRIIEKKGNIFSAEWNVYLTNDDNGPYYKVWQDVDTESVSFYSTSISSPETIIRPLSGYPFGVHTISEVILIDMRRRGFVGYKLDSVPWCD